MNQHRRATDISWRHPIRFVRAWHPIRRLAAWYDHRQVQVGTVVILAFVGWGFHTLSTQQDTTLDRVNDTLVAIAEDIDAGDERRVILEDVQEALARIEEVAALQRCQFGILLVALDFRLETIENLPPNTCGLTDAEIAELKEMVLGAAPTDATTTTGDPP